MNFELWPRSLRWMLSVPVAFVASMTMHFLLTLGLSNDGYDASIFGIGIEGPSARWLLTIWREGIMRYLEPWAFVAALGIIAPARNVPSIAAAALVSVLFVALLTFQLSHHASTVPAALRAIVGIGGAIAGALTAIRSKRKTRDTRPAHSH